MSTDTIVQREGLGWKAHALVEKWDDDQVAWVTRKTGIVAPEGGLLARYSDPYEVTEEAGNLLTTAGLTRICSLIVAAGGQGLTNTATRLGVGNSATAATAGDTDLNAAAGAGNRYFMTMDATFPSASAAVITAKATFATGDANFAWQEWGLDIGTPTVSAGTTVNAVLLNHKVASLGTKVSGSWALTVTVTLS